LKKGSRILFSAHFLLKPYSFRGKYLQDKTPLPILTTLSLLKIMAVGVTCTGPDVSAKTRAKCTPYNLTGLFAFNSLLQDT
jgi:hypothetical protein